MAWSKYKHLKMIGCRYSGQRSTVGICGLIVIVEIKYKRTL